MTARSGSHGQQECWSEVSEENIKEVLEQRRGEPHIIAHFTREEVLEPDSERCANKTAQVSAW